jgi:hypothetical protein
MNYIDSKIGMGSMIRTNSGMFIEGRAITAQLLAKYLRKCKVTTNRIAEMLDLKDGQNVPLAIELIDMLKKIHDIPDYKLDLAEQHDKRAIKVFAELFGSYV